MCQFNNETHNNPRKIERKRGVHIHKKLLFFVFSKKKLCGLRVLCGSFFSSCLEGAEHGKDYRIS